MFSGTTVEPAHHGLNTHQYSSSNTSFSYWQFLQTPITLNNESVYTVVLSLLLRARFRGDETAYVNEPYSAVSLH